MGDEGLGGSVRPDGSVRKAVRIRPGWVPPEERPKYRPPAKRQDSAQLQQIESPLPVMYVTRPYYGKFPSQMADDELDIWLRERKWLRPLPGPP